MPVSESPNSSTGNGALTATEKVSRLLEGKMTKAELEKHTGSPAAITPEEPDRAASQKQAEAAAPDRAKPPARPAETPPRPALEFPDEDEASPKKKPGRSLAEF